jgi:hypothetical protein
VSPCHLLNADFKFHHRRLVCGQVVPLTKSRGETLRKKGTVLPLPSSSSRVCLGSRRSSAVSSVSAEPDRAVCVRLRRVGDGRFRVISSAGPVSTVPSESSAVPSIGPAVGGRVDTPDLERLPVGVAATPSLEEHRLEDLRGFQECLVRLSEWYTCVSCGCGLDGSEVVRRPTNNHRSYGGRQLHSLRDLLAPLVYTPRPVAQTLPPGLANGEAPEFELAVPVVDRVATALRAELEPYVDSCVLAPAGITDVEERDAYERSHVCPSKGVTLCDSCDRRLRVGVIPEFSLRAGYMFAPLVPELQGLTRLECQLISPYCVFVFLHRLQGTGQTMSRGSSWAMENPLSSQ